MGTAGTRRRPRTGVKKRLLEWMGELGFATTRQILRAMDCQTWGQKVYVYRSIAGLIERGRLHEIGDDRRGGQRVLFAGSPDRTNWLHALGAGDLKIAVARSCQALGYPHTWAGANLRSVAGLAADGLLVFEKPGVRGEATRRLVVMEYQRTKLSCRRAAEKLQRYAVMSEELKRTFAVTDVYTLASFDLWPLGYSERWLAALVREAADWNLFVTSHVRLLETPAQDVMTSSIWYRYGYDERVSLFVKE